MRVTVEDPDGRRVIIDPGEQRAALEKAAEKVPAEEWEGETVATRIVKATPELRYSLHVAYPVNKADVTVAADGHRDFSGEAALCSAAWSYLTKSPKVGLWHQDGTEGPETGQVVESYIWPSDQDWIITATDGSQQIVTKGDWLVGIRWSEQTWPLVLKGRINGVSMQGKATRRRPSAEALARLRK